MRNRAVFSKAISHLQELHGIDRRAAMKEVQADYDKYMEANQQLTLEQDRQGNAANIQLVSHFALLATLSLTVVGFLFQSAPNLTDPQKALVLTVLIAQTLSLSLGAADYVVTIMFHRKWAQAYFLVGKEINRKFELDELQLISDLYKVEEDIIKDKPRTTPIWITVVMVTSCLIGLLALILLFYIYLFDVPFSG